MHTSFRNECTLDVHAKLLYKMATQIGDPILYVELMNINRVLNRPVSAYGYLLRARRLGAKIPHGTAAEIENILKMGDIFAASKDPTGAYIMGSELARFPDCFEAAVYYLQEAVENGDIHGVAALDLGELLESYPEHKKYYSQMANRYFKIAAARGNPQYLSVKRKPQ